MSAVTAPAPLLVSDLGRVSYEEAWELQRRLVQRRLDGETGDLLLLCEHDPVVTTGRRTGADALVDRRFPVFEVERGGEATYHGPGQVVAYPILRLADDRRDLHAYLRALEGAIAEAVASSGMETSRRAGATGVWTADGARKLASIGVAARRWVTYHGLALNHETDLSHFAAIRPCGFDATVMTSLRAELGERCPPRETLVAALTDALQAALAPFRARGGAP